MSCSHTPPAGTLAVEPAWLTETVLALARGVAADLRFDRLPILADALEDAGCDNFALLNHLRSHEPHLVGCWALRQLLRTTLLLPGGVPLTFAYCPPGSFVMGTPTDVGDEDEHPARLVAITRPLQVGIFPVTQEQWRAVMGTDPSEVRGDRRPVEQVSWPDATAFCARVVEFADRPVRLPTEAEWEYFARAGTATEYHYGHSPSPDWMNSSQWPTAVQTTDVGSYPPNRWGLFDTHGNVMEWCEDWYASGFYTVGGATDPVCREPGGRPDDPSRCCRGGSWRYNAAGCRSAHRNYRTPGSTENCVGFRVVFTAV
jgi:formylglycine-generating enzyme required for sulfatase activity